MLRIAEGGGADGLTGWISCPRDPVNVSGYCFCHTGGAIDKRYDCVRWRTGAFSVLHICLCMYAHWLHTACTHAHTHSRCSVLADEYVIIIIRLMKPMLFVYQHGCCSSSPVILVVMLIISISRCLYDDCCTALLFVLRMICCTVLCHSMGIHAGGHILITEASRCDYRVGIISLSSSSLTI